MKGEEFSRLFEYFTKANILTKRIDELKKMISGIERRLDDGSRDLRMYVSSRNPRHGGYDTGVDVTLPERMLRDAILPALKNQLKMLKENFAKMEAPVEFRSSAYRARNKQGTKKT